MVFGIKEFTQQSETTFEKSKKIRTKNHLNFPDKISSIKSRKTRLKIFQNFPDKIPPIKNGKIKNFPEFPVLNFTNKKPGKFKIVQNFQQKFTNKNRKILQPPKIQSSLY